MSFRDIVCEKMVVFPLEAATKEEAIGTLLQKVYESKKIPEYHSAMEAVMARERLSCTGIGRGVAVPHGSLKGLDKIQIIFGVSKSGVNYGSIDDAPVHFFMLILTPHHTRQGYLQILGRCCHLLREEGWRHKVLNASSTAIVEDLLEPLNF